MCPSPKLPIGGDGPQPCNVLFIGEGPGKQEDRRRDERGEGRPFVGDSGAELDGLYLPLAGLRREHVRVTNIVRCIPDPLGGNPSPLLAKCCMGEWMLGELNQTQPQVIVTLGAIAYHTMFPDAPSLEHQHGRPFIGTFKSWTGMVIPMYRPAAGMRRSDLMADLISDFRDLKRILAGEDVIPQDEYPNPRYEEITNRRELRKWLEPGEETGVIAIDTETEPVEGDEHYPYCLSLSVEMGTGGVVKLEWEEVLRVLREWILDTRARVAMHNQPFDVRVLKKMGVLTPKFHDTQAMVYHLQTLPQGLKTLAHRYLGVRMTDFDDVVRPYAVRKVQEYLREAWEEIYLPEAFEGDPEGRPMVALPNPFGDLTTTTSKTTKKGGTKYTTKLLGEVKRRGLYKEWLNVELTPEVIEQYRRHPEGVIPAPGEEKWFKAFLAVVNEYRTGEEKLAGRLSRTVQNLDKYAAAVMRDEGEEGEGEESDEEKAKKGDPWALWREWRKRDKERGTQDIPRIIQAAGGKVIPPLSIRYTPWDEVVRYAGRDADVTLRLYRLVRRLRSNVWARILGER